jgi:hypothetical protein
MGCAGLIEKKIVSFEHAPLIYLEWEVRRWLWMVTSKPCARKAVFVLQIAVPDLSPEKLRETTKNFRITSRWTWSIATFSAFL